jgi:hypothetical protein
MFADELLTVKVHRAHRPLTPVGCCKGEVVAWKVSTEEIIDIVGELQNSVQSVQTNGT